MFDSGGGEGGGGGGDGGGGGYGSDCVWSARMRSVSEGVSGVGSKARQLDLG